MSERRPHPSDAPASEGQPPETEGHKSEEPQSVEALIGWRDFLAMAPRRRSVASTTAAAAALARWMRRHGHDTNGFYTMDQWQTFYRDTMADTGATR